MYQYKANFSSLIRLSLKRRETEN